MPKGLTRALRALAVTLTLYSLLGFLLIPGLALRLINQQLSLQASEAASLQRLQLNPFTLEVQAWGLRIGTPEQEPIRLEQLYADLQWSSLWQGRLHLGEVRLQQPQIAVAFAADGQLNLAQLFKPGPTSEPPSESADSPMPAIRLERLAIRQGALAFADQRLAEPIALDYQDLDLQLLHLDTRATEHAALQLSAQGAQGGKLDWQGTLQLQPLQSSGQLSLRDVQLQALWPYVREHLPLQLKGGALQVAAQYTLDLSQGTDLRLQQLHTRLNSLALHSDSDQPLLKLASLELHDGQLDLAKQQLHLGRIDSQALQAWLSREADGQLNWQKVLAQPPGRTTPAAPPAATPPNESSEPAETAETAETSNQPWHIQVKALDLRDYQLHLADHTVNPPLALELSQLQLSLQNFDSRSTQPFPVSLQSQVGKQGRLKSSGQVQLQPLAAELAIDAQQLDLRLAQGYLNPYVRLELRSGLLGSQLQVSLRDGTPLQLQVRGAAQVEQLHSLDRLKGRDFVRWKKLNLDGLDYQHGEHLHIASVDLQQPYVRFIINEDRTTNLGELLIPQPASAPPAAAPASPLALRIGGIAINDGSANFADFSLMPSFATAIQQLHGRIGTLDSQRNSAARVDISGKVDKYAPVSIKGQLTPFDPLAKLDIATQFKRVELTTLTPYSGKFAGYRIRKGRLNLDLHYRIEQGKLNADNAVVLEQLQLGEKVDSPDAVDLPIRLAVALLKDTEGKIEIRLPVQGDLNNPEFSVMPIVWQTLRNLVLRAAQAPFKFVAGLVGGNNADLSVVPFAAGSQQLDGAAQDNLRTLGKALQDRPALRLEIEALASTAADGPHVAAARLEREYQYTWYRLLQRRGERVPASARELQVPEDDKPALLEGIYRARLKQQPPAAWRELDDEQRTAQLRQALLQHWQGSNLLLRQLAQTRATAIKDFLVSEAGLEDSRVYLLDVSVEAGEPERASETRLHLDSL